MVRKIVIFFCYKTRTNPATVFGAEPEQPEQAEGDDDPVPILTCRHCQKRIFLVKIIEPRIEAVCDSKPPCTLVYHKHCWVDVQKFVSFVDPLHSH
jgi:hypothetical protein